MGDSFQRGIAKYMEGAGVDRNAELMKTRLEMWDVGRNHGKDRYCQGCTEEKESTEHILQFDDIKIVLNQIG